MLNCLPFRAPLNSIPEACNQEKKLLQPSTGRVQKWREPSVIERLGFVLDEIGFPDSVPHTWDIDFDEEQQIAVIDIGLPDVVHRPLYKTVILKSGAVKNPLNQTERKELSRRCIRQFY